LPQSSISKRAYISRSAPSPTELYSRKSYLMIYTLHLESLLASSGLAND